MWYGETESVCLALSVVGILAQYHCFHGVKRSAVKGIEDFRSWGVDRIFIFFCVQKIFQFCKVGGLKFIPQGMFPAFFDIG